MKLKRPNKQLEDQIRLVVKKMKCPIHSKEPTISMDDENSEVKVEACCPFFKKDVFTEGERLRKDFLRRDAARREREEKERLRKKFGSDK